MSHNSGHDAGDECCVGAELIALFGIMSCSAGLVVPICRQLCVRFPCGEALVTRGGLKGSDSVLDAGDEGGAGARVVALVVIVPCSVKLDHGAEMVALVVIVPCSVGLVVPICWHQCGRNPLW